MKLLTQLVAAFLAFIFGISAYMIWIAYRMPALDAEEEIICIEEATIKSREW